MGTAPCLPWAAFPTLGQCGKGRPVRPCSHWQQEAAVITRPFTVTFHALFIFALFPLGPVLLLHSLF